MIGSLDDDYDMAGSAPRSIQEGISSRVNMREGDREVPELLRIYFTLGRFR